MSDSRKAAEQAYGAVCVHGQLARSCNICELERERDEWKAKAHSLAESLGEAISGMDQWRAKAEANERDAGRYRYLRDKEDGDLFMENVGSDLDRAIDAARSAEKEKE